MWTKEGRIKNQEDDEKIAKPIKNYNMTQAISSESYKGTNSMSSV